VTGAAGQPTQLCRALREYGVESHSVILGSNPYGYKADFEFNGTTLLDGAVLRFFEWALEYYDIFHFHFRPFIFRPGKFYYPFGVDLLMVLAAEKKLIMHFRGSEVRAPSQFRIFSPYNYVDENPSNIFTKFNDDSVSNYINQMSALCHKILVPDEELKSYVPNATIVRRVAPELDAATLTLNAKQNRHDLNKLIIAHAPTRQIVKGTKFIETSIATVRQAHPNVAYRRVEGMPHESALTMYATSDIVIDQLRIGWYGNLSLEAMSLGKPVVAYIREDLVKYLPQPLPLINANPESLTDVLASLVTNKEMREEVALAASQFVKEFHSSKAVGESLLNVYSEVMRDPKHPNLRPLLNVYFSEQREPTRRTPRGFGKSALTLRVGAFLQHVRVHGIQSAVREARRHILLWSRIRN
jgi:hypothetical protein